MNKTNFTISLATLGVASLGTAMKLFHLPASNIVLLLGVLGVLYVFLPTMIRLVGRDLQAYTSSRKIITYSSATLLFLGICAKLFHLPAANIVLIFGLVVCNLLFIQVLKRKHV